MWTSLQVTVDGAAHRGRFRLQGEMLILEWTGGRHHERCGFLKPDFVAMTALKRLASRPSLAA